jgi:flavodoxin
MINMKTLIVFYSRSGNTKKVAETLSNSLECDLEEIVDTQKRSGVIGFLNSGYQANRRKLAVIQDIKNDPAQYDLLIIGTPVWSSNMSTPIRTYLHQNQGKFNRVAFFCTESSSGDEKTFKEMEELCGKSPISTLVLKVKRMDPEICQQNINQFVAEIQ